MVNDHVRIAQGRLRETFVPLAHPLEHAQVDFGEAVAVIGGIRQRIHHLFRDRFGRPGKGNDKGKVEGLVKYARSNFMTPIPQAASFTDLNAILADRCRQRQSEIAGRHAGTIGERLAAISPPSATCPPWR